MSRPQHVVRVPLYALLVGLLVTVASPLLSILAAVQIAERNAERTIAEQRRTEEAARTESRRLTCTFFALNLDVYDQTPPSTAVGRNLRQTYLEFYRLSECQPARK
jgi:hypothetical protein